MTRCKTIPILRMLKLKSSCCLSPESPELYCIRQVFWLAPVIERPSRLPLITPKEEARASGKSVVQNVFLFLPLLKERIGVRLSLQLRV